jgi:hypothetical protein
MNTLPHTGSRGITVLLVIAFMGVFALILSAISGFALQQGRYGRILYDREQALHSAEAGLEYYRWFLAHNPNDLQNGTGVAGPYTYSVLDPEGGEIGKAYLTVTANAQCGVNQWIDITSIGKSNLNPSFPRTLSARYMRTSVAAYSYLLNSNVWAGADRNITGPYFSNGGIRMDGSNNSDVSSAVATWNCDSSFGCSPTQTKNGVFGAGTGSALWHYPATSIDFAGIAANFATLKSRAQNNGGLYFAPAAGTLTQRGYHLIFNGNNTVTVRRVTSTTAIPSYSDQSGWVTEYGIIATETNVGTYTIPASCSLIYVEDRVWVEGTVSGKVTLVAADVVNTNNYPNAYLVNNISYATNDGTSGFTLIAEGSVRIPLNSPDTMSVRGIFVAQTGHYGRDFYTNDGSYPSNQRVGNTWSSYVAQTSLTTKGTVVSNGRTGTSWSCGGSFCSGYQIRTDAYDALQAVAPPPFTPSASTDYDFVQWMEL